MYLLVSLSSVVFFVILNYLFDLLKNIIVLITLRYVIFFKREQNNIFKTKCNAHSSSLIIYYIA